MPYANFFKRPLKPLYHGSSARNWDVIDPSRFGHRDNFGAAFHLAEDPGTAAMYGTQQRQYALSRGQGLDLFGITAEELEPFYLTLATKAEREALGHALAGARGTRQLAPADKVIDTNLPASQQEQYYPVAFHEILEDDPGIATRAGFGAIRHRDIDDANWAVYDLTMMDDLNFGDPRRVAPYSKEQFDQASALDQTFQRWLQLKQPQFGDLQTGRFLPRNAEYEPQSFDQQVRQALARALRPEDEPVGDLLRVYAKGDLGFFPNFSGDFSPEQLARVQEALARELPGASRVLAKRGGFGRFSNKSGPIAKQRSIEDQLAGVFGLGHTPTIGRNRHWRDLYGPPNQVTLDTPLYPELFPNIGYPKFADEKQAAAQLALEQARNLQPGEAQRIYTPDVTLGPRDAKNSGYAEGPGHEWLTVSQNRTPIWDIDNERKLPLEAEYQVPIIEQAVRTMQHAYPELPMQTIEAMLRDPRMAPKDDPDLTRHHTFSTIETYLGPAEAEQYAQVLGRNPVTGQDWKYLRLSNVLRSGAYALEALSGQYPDFRVRFGETPNTDPQDLNTTGLVTMTGPTITPAAVLELIRKISPSRYELSVTPRGSHVTDLDDFPRGLSERLEPPPFLASLVDPNYLRHTEDKQKFSTRVTPKDPNDPTDFISVPGPQKVTNPQRRLVPDLIDSLVTESRPTQTEAWRAALLKQLEGMSRIDREIFLRNAGLTPALAFALLGLDTEDAEAA